MTKKITLLLLALVALQSATAIREGRMLQEGGEEALPAFVEEPVSNRGAARLLWRRGAL